MNTGTETVILLASKYETMADGQEETIAAVTAYNMAEELYRSVGFNACADTARKDAQDRLFGRDSHMYVFCKEA